MREPDSALPEAVTEDDSGAAPTVLRTLVEGRHWRTPKAFRAQFLRAARELADRECDREFGRLDVSERQFCRWLAGAQPRPYSCRVLEYLFGLPVGELMRPADSPVLAPATPAGPGPVVAPELAVARVQGAAPVEVRLFVGADGLLPAVAVGAADVVVQAGSVRVLIGPAAGVVPAVATGPDRVACSAGGARVYSLDAARRHRLGQAG